MNTFRIISKEKQEIQNSIKLMDLLGLNYEKGIRINLKSQVSNGNIGEQKEVRIYYVSTKGSEGKGKTYYNYESFKKSLKIVPDFSIKLGSVGEAKRVLGLLKDVFILDKDWNDFIVDECIPKSKDEKDLKISYGVEDGGKISLFTVNTSHDNEYDSFEQWEEEFLPHFDHILPPIKRKGFNINKEDMYIAAGIYHRDLQNKWNKFAINYANNTDGISNHDTKLASRLYLEFTHEELAIFMVNNLKTNNG